MLPKNLKKYFWDVDFKQVDWKSNPEFVIARLLEYGDVKSIQWLLRTFNAEEIKKVIFIHRGFSPKSANFWKLFFNINEDKIACLKKPYQKTQKTHWPY